MSMDIGSPEGHRKRLREKYLQLGDEAFMDYEILELLLSYSIARRDVKPMAKKLFANFKSLNKIVDAKIPELTACEGIGENSALLIKLIRAVAFRYLRAGINESNYLDSSIKFCDYARMQIGGAAQELFMAFFMDINCKLIETKVLSEGLVDCVPLVPALVAKHALNCAAKMVVVCHNHPGGSLVPSSADRSLTLDLRDVLFPLSIHLLDHLIVTEEGFFSFRHADEQKPVGLRLLHKDPPSLAEKMKRKGKNI